MLPLLVLVLVLVLVLLIIIIIIIIIIIFIISLIRGGGGLMQIRGGSMIFMQGKKGGTHFYAGILGSFVIQRGVRGMGQQKMCFTKRRFRII